MLEQDDIRVIVALICNEQNEIIKNNNYNSEEYLKLEQIKVKIKSGGKKNEVCSG